ncbi:MAG: hypothetical protein ING89_07785 [Rubrivivax sp.]|nr:hypothetical protein [Rubrivivax sp.]
MEQQTLLKIARLRTHAARSGRAFDVVRFAQDPAFAKATLQQLMDSDDEALIVLGLELMQALGMVRLDPPAAPPAPAAESQAPQKKEDRSDRYIGRLH